MQNATHRTILAERAGDQAVIYGIDVALSLRQTLSNLGFETVGSAGYGNG